MQKLLFVKHIVIKPIWNQFICYLTLLLLLLLIKVLQMRILRTVLFQFPVSSKDILFCVCMTETASKQQKHLSIQTCIPTIQSVYTNWERGTLWRPFCDTEVLCAAGNRRPPYPHSLDILRRVVQPHCEFRFLCPLRGGGGVAWCPLYSQSRHFARTLLTRRNFEKDERGKRNEAYFLGVLRVVSTSLVRGRKQQLIAQEEEKGSLIWRPQWCSSLQPHGELISTWAIDRKERRGWKEEKEEGGLLSVFFFFVVVRPLLLTCGSTNTISYIIFICCYLERWLLICYCGHLHSYCPIFCPFPRIIPTPNIWTLLYYSADHITVENK